MIGANGLVGEELDIDGVRAVGVGVLSDGINGARGELIAIDIDAEGI